VRFISKPNANSSTGGVGTEFPLREGGFETAVSKFIKTPDKKQNNWLCPPKSTRQGQIRDLVAQVFHFFDEARKNESSTLGMVYATKTSSLDRFWAIEV
jgi:hypothetical protein